MILEENIPLAPLTTLGVGGCARWFVTAGTEGDISQALAFAAERSLPVFVLGGGSNLLISDRGFHGLVIHVALRGIQQRELEDGGVLLQVAAGESWGDLVQLAVERDLAGMECLAGIPGDGWRNTRAERGRVWAGSCRDHPFDSLPRHTHFRVR